MIIKAISEEKAIAFLREWNGQNPGAKLAEAERMFRASCERYVRVDVEDQQELNRLDMLEEYITDSRCFYLYLRCPSEVAAAVRAGKTELPRFFQRAEERYCSTYGHGPVRLLIGIMQQRLDPGYNLDLFIDLLDRQKREAQAYQTQPPQGPVSQQTPTGSRQPERSNVVNYHFGRQVS